MTLLRLYRQADAGDAAREMLASGAAAAVVLAAVAPIFLLVNWAPAPLVLPLLAVTWMAIAAVVAAIGLGLRPDRRPGEIGLWDIAAGFLFMGCAAALLSDPDALVALLGPASAD